MNACLLNGNGKISWYVDYGALPFEPIQGEITRLMFPVSARGYIILQVHYIAALSRGQKNWGAHNKNHACQILLFSGGVKNILVCLIFVQ